MSDLTGLLTGFSVSDGLGLGGLAVIGLIVFRFLVRREDRIRDGADTSLRAQHTEWRARAIVAEAQVRIYQADHGPIPEADVLAEVRRVSALRELIDRPPPPSPAGDG